MPSLVINARNAALSTGLNVRRILPYMHRRMVGPFIFLDHAGPVTGFKSAHDFSSMDVLPHPHIGLTTVTYLLGGQVTHRDSLGIEQLIRPGEVNWMTAGRGIAHSERFEDPGLLAAGAMEMLQTWVALPKEDEECTPDFVNYRPYELPIFTDKGIWMRLIAGNAYGLNNTVRTHSPLFYIHVELDDRAQINLPDGYTERAIYIPKGSILIGNEKYSQGQMIVFDKNEDPIITALEPSTIMLLGGEPLGNRYIYWNFVSSSKERIEQAKEDWKSGRIQLPPHDNVEFIPLPEEKRRLSEPPEPPLLS